MAVTQLGDAGVSKIRLSYGGTSVLVSDFTGLDQAFMGAMNEDYLTGEKIDDHTAGQLIFLGVTEAGAMVKIPARVALTRYRLIRPGAPKSAGGNPKPVKPASETPGESSAAGMKPKDAPETAPKPDSATAGSRKRPIIRGVEVPELPVLKLSKEMANQALDILAAKTGGWPAADKAAFWSALAEQIEAAHSPAWVATLFEGTKGEFVFSGKDFGVHGLVIDKNGRTFRIGLQVDIRFVSSIQKVTVTPRAPKNPAQ